MPQALAKTRRRDAAAALGHHAAIIGFYLALGTFMEGFSMIVTTIPVVFPIVMALGYDPIWFGVIVTMLVEIALISPPDGTVLYVLQGMRGTAGRSPTSSSGVMPFMTVYILAIGDADGRAGHRALAAARGELTGAHPANDCAAGVNRAAQPRSIQTVRSVRRSSCRWHAAAAAGNQAGSSWS